MLISLNQAAERIGINRSTVGRDSRKQPVLLPFVDNGDGVQIDDECEEWTAYVKKKQSRGQKTAKKSIKKVLKKEKLVDIPIEKQAKTEKKLIKKDKKVNKLNGEFEGQESEQEHKQSKPKSAYEIQKEREKQAAIEIDEAMKDGKPFELTPQMSLITISKMEKVYKAQELSEKALMARNKRLLQEKELMDIEVGLYVFGSFMERMKQEWGGLPHKLMPQTKSMLLNGQEKEAEKLWLREFEAIYRRVTKEQVEALENWKKE